VLRDGQWSKQPAFIVGGGPSLRTFDWGLLKGFHNIIAINAAMFNCPWASAFFTEDLRFIDRFVNEPAWKSFQGTKVFHALHESQLAQAVRLDPHLQVIERKREDKFWSRSLSEGLCWSSNSGIGAMNLACILGGDPIYLLGFDCRKRAPGGNPNYHEHYPQDWRMPLGQEDNFRSDFEHWAWHWMRDRRVVNLTSREEPSAITCWPRYDRDLVLQTGIEDAQSLIAMPRVVPP